jgi:hypothetical protein
VGMGFVFFLEVDVWIFLIQTSGCFGGLSDAAGF